MRFSLGFIVVCLSVYILSAASSFFIPLAIAFVSSYLIIAIAEGLRNIHVFGKKLPISLSFIAALLILGLGGYFIFSIVEKNVYELIERAPIYQERLNTLMKKEASQFHLETINLYKIIGQYDLGELLRSLVLVITQVLGSAGIIIVYILFFLIEYGFYDKKLQALFPDKAHLDKAKRITHKIGTQIQSYLKIKTWISLITGALTYVVLKTVGVDFAEFWGLLAFLLNYIPTIGSIIATLFPCLLAFVQFDSMIPFIIVTSVLISIQFFIGNVIEPRIMGSHFNLSGLVILLSLIIWGKIWGVIGVFLCVPLLMIINIILANFPPTRPIAVLLSQNGKID